MHSRFLRFVVALFLAALVSTCLGRGLDLTAETPSQFVYKTASGIPLHVFVFDPDTQADIDARRPAIVIFHGGAWRRGSPKKFEKFARQFSERTGMVAITVRYRIQGSDGTSPLEAVEDAISSIRWVRDNAQALKIDPERVAALGGSAGGHLALATAMFGKTVEGETSSIPNALVLYNPVVDLTGHWEEVFGMDLRAVSPMQHIHGPLPPTLILQGTADKVAPLKTLNRFITAIREKGGSEIQLVTYPGREHGFYRKDRVGREDYSATFNEVVSFFERLGWIDGKETTADSDGGIAGQ